tara:strand:+ start:1260 stop:1496 length:237 start_codon:yes stop_codon:yes gene_type:complete
MGKHLSTYYKDHSKAYCEIHVDMKEEMFYIKFYNDSGKQFFVEEFPNKSHRYVEDAAENWALGIKLIEEEGVKHLGSL